MKCVNCREEFDGSYIGFGGGVFCDEDCLAEFTVDQDIDVEKVEEGMVRHE